MRKTSEDDVNSTQTFLQPYYPPLLPIAKQAVAAG